MVNAVFTHKDNSVYDDDLVSRYDFPALYLSRVEQTVGDWIVYYRPGRVRSRVYFAVAKVMAIEPNPNAKDRHYARFEPGTYLPLDMEVPRTRESGAPYEAALTAKDGMLQTRGGRITEAVRLLSPGEFADILKVGLPQDLVERDEAQWRANPSNEVAEPAALFERPVVERLTSQRFREVTFRRRVCAAYDNRCAISGLHLLNGGGRPEVQAAHIRPVSKDGPDAVHNGLALSGTLHWMFDRGLISIAEDHRVLVSDNKVDRDTRDRLLRPDMRLQLPRDARDHPHPVYLKWHREHVFGQLLS